MTTLAYCTTFNTKRMQIPVVSTFTEGTELTPWGQNNS